MTTNAINIAVGEIEKLADRVGALSSAVFGSAATEALNDTIDKTYESSIDRITSGVNLEDTYVRRRMEVTYASAQKLEASIVATGENTRMTRLVHYGASPRIVPRKTTGKERGGGLIYPMGQGAKQGGVAVQVKRGNNKTMRNAFMLPLRQGDKTGEKLGVFTRVNGALKHLYGPSVYQLFRHTSALMLDKVVQDLESTLLTLVERELEDVL